TTSSRLSCRPGSSCCWINRNNQPRRTTTRSASATKYQTQLRFLIGFSNSSTKSHEKTRKGQERLARRVPHPSSAIVDTFPARHTSFADAAGSPVFFRVFSCDFVDRLS